MNAAECLGTQAGEQFPSVGSTDLALILSAWESATERLQHTHEVLRDEVRRLTDELEAKNRALARKDRLADLGQMASHVAHEVRNSLSPVKLYLSVLRRHLVELPEEIGILDKATRGLVALENTVTDLLHFTADRDPVRCAIDIRVLFDEITDSLRPQFDAQGVQVVNRVEPSLRLEADRDMLRRAIMNLVLNSIDAMPAGGSLIFDGCRHDNLTELEITDSGKGIPDNVLRRVFEPFFTTKSQGTGLGLSIVFRIVELHGGDIVARNAADGGATFSLRIPHSSRKES